MEVERGAEGSTRHYGLDGLRGLAALLVATYHYLHNARGLTIASMGTFPVYLFFSLSALTMLLAYSGRLSSRSEIARFYAARVARIMPLLAVTSLGMVVLGKFAPDIVAKALLTATGLFAVAPGALSVGNGTWSLGIELIFYAVFPALLMQRWRLSTLLVLTVAAIVVQQAYIWLLADSWETYISPVTFAPFFLIGFVVYKAGRRGGASPLPAFACLVLLSLASFAFDVRDTMLGYLAGMAMVAAALWLAWRSEPSDRLRPLCAFLGRISYSLYLTHWFVFVATRHLGLGWPAFMALAIAVAWLCERILERPLRDMLIRSFGKSRTGIGLAEHKGS